jgi:hypothetical protein
MQKHSGNLKWVSLAERGKRRKKVVRNDLEKAGRSQGQKGLRAVSRTLGLHPRP